MKQAISIALILLCGLSYAQQTFVPGYIIDNQNIRTECLILNRDWKNNPAAFNYKLAEAGPELTGDTTSVAEFGIIGGNSYIRAVVNIDRSSNEMNNLSEVRNPVWSKETLFLKVLFRGSASLYYYEMGTIARMFYQVGEKPIEQLIYKKYRELKNGTAGTMISENATFRQQLYRDVRCESTNQQTLERLQYFPQKMTKYFQDFAICTGDVSSINKQNLSNKTSYHLDVNTGIFFNSYEVSNSRSNENYEFKQGVSYRIGLGNEFILPFYNDRLGAVVELGYQGFKSEVEGEPLTNVSFTAMEVAFGARYRFISSEKSSLYLNGLFSQSFSKNEAINRNRRTPIEMEKRSPGYMVGLGYNYKKFALELRYLTVKPLHNYVAWSEDFHRLGLIIKYQIL